MDSVNKFSLQFHVIEEAASCARITYSRSLACGAESLGGNFFSSANYCYGARSHMLFFADHSGHAYVQIMAKRFCGMLEQSALFARFTRRHGWRQVNQPFGVD